VHFHGWISRRLCRRGEGCCGAPSPEPSTSSSDASSDSSSSDGERLPAQQTTRSGRVSRPPAQPLINPGKLYSDKIRESRARRASGEAAAAKRQREA
jgi:hypothetical protein